MSERISDKKNENLPRAALAIVVAVCILSFGDATIKWFSLSLPIWQLFVLRSLLVIPVLLVMIRYWHPEVSLLPRSVMWVSLRSLLLTKMLIAYYLALPHLQLPVAAAAYYTSPIFITIFSGLFAKEPTGLRGWFAIGLGFIGAIITLRPAASGFNVFVLLPILAAIFYALAMILTRTKCQNENTLVLTAAMNVGFIVVGIVVSLCLLAVDLTSSATSANPFLLGNWVSLGINEFSYLAILAVAFFLGSLFVTIAYQSAPSSIVSTFDYSYLAFSVLWGVLIFTQLK